MLKKTKKRKGGSMQKPKQWNSDLANQMISDIFVFSGWKLFLEENKSDKWKIELFKKFISEIKTPEEFEEKMKQEEDNETPIGSVSLYILFSYHRFLFLNIKKGKMLTRTDLIGAWEKYIEHMKMVCDLERLAKIRKVPKEQRGGPEKIIQESIKRFSDHPGKYKQEEINYFIFFSQNYMHECMGKKEN